MCSSTALSLTSLKRRFGSTSDDALGAEIEALMQRRRDYAREHRGPFLEDAHAQLDAARVGISHGTPRAPRLAPPSTQVRLRTCGGSSINVDTIPRVVRPLDFASRAPI
jgi:hypothetical protein